MALFLVAACDPGEAGSGPDPLRGDAGGSEPEPEVTYHRDIRPLIERSCTKCHEEGGVAPFPLETWTDVEPRAFRIVDAVVSRIMPPSQTDPNCREIIDGNWMTQAEVDLFAAWADEEYPEGDPSDYVAPVVDPPQDLGPPDFVARMPEPYTPTWSTKGDDFLVVDLEGTLPEDMYVRAARFVPGEPTMVHHGLAVPRDADRNIIQTQDGGLVEPVAAYVPGGPTFVLPEGAAFVLPAGGSFYVTIHYHKASLPDAENPPSDQSELHLWGMPADQVTHRAGVRAIQDWELDIPAGESEVIEGTTYPLPDETPFSVFAAIPHMHYLGDRIRVEVLRDEDGSSECLFYEPYYAFQWQLMHRFEPIHFDGGESGRITCVYDNTRENQPYVNGQQLLPRDVTFGGSSLDEMCMSYLFVMWPYTVQ